MIGDITLSDTEIIIGLLLVLIVLVFLKLR